MNVVAIAGKVFEVTLNKLSNGKSVAKVVVQVYGAGDYVDGKSKPGFIKAEFWDEQAEFVNKNFTKGDPIGVTGQWKQHLFEDKAGNKRRDDFIAMARASFVGAPKAAGEVSNEAAALVDAVAGTGGAGAGEPDPFDFAGVGNV